MSDTDQEKMDDVLRRMLATPPTPHKPVSRGGPKPDPDRSHKKPEDQPS